MNKTQAALAAILLATSATLVCGSAHAAAPRQEARLLEARQVLEDTALTRDQAIPDWLLRRAHGIAIIPGVVKVGLGIGGRGGRGVLVARDERGHWSNPAFVTLAGGSIGWQAGVQESDIILVFMTRRSIEGITGGKFTLGADASAAVGPVGRQVSASTDITLDAEVYSYSRARGLFGGIAIDGTVIRIDHRGNAAFYGRRDVLASDILNGRVTRPASAEPLLATLGRLTGANGRPAAASAAAPAARPVEAAPVERRGLESGGATTFPLDEEPRT